MRAQPLLTDLLKQVSRSFYLTLRVLPAAVRPQIGLAYLLARTTDTIADTEIVSLDQRLAALRHLNERISGAGSERLNLGELAGHQGLPAERVLLERVEEALSLLEALPAEDKRLVREVLRVIVSGQELDLRRFARTQPGQILALENDAQLDDYTYRVAGCVGEFWTRMCRAHLFPGAKLDDERLLADGVRFGKGLQLVNILRDLPADLKQGRCYLPEKRLALIGLTPESLLNSANFSTLKPLYVEYVAQAEDHLRAGWEYTNALPWGSFRVRLACAWPVLIGNQTLKTLRTKNALDARERIKVSRADVRGVILRTILLYPLPFMWRRLN